MRLKLKADIKTKFRWYLTELSHSKSLLNYFTILTAHIYKTLFVVKSIKKASRLAEKKSF